MIQSFPSSQALADAVARHVVACAEHAITSRGRFTLALSGGSTPREAYQRLATKEFSRQLDWQRTDVFWTDERAVPPDDSRSNYGMAKEALLERVPIPAHNIHRVRTEDSPERAAREYETELRKLLAAAGHPGFDLILLGLGEDGHTASLFPGQSAFRETTRWVMAVPAPDGKLWRVTLTPALINAARNVTFIVSGGSKAARLKQVIEGPFAPDSLPAQAISPLHGKLTWMIDAAAGSQLDERPSIRQTSG